MCFIGRPIGRIFRSIAASRLLFYYIAAQRSEIPSLQFSFLFRTYLYLAVAYTEGESEFPPFQDITFEFRRTLRAWKTFSIPKDIRIALA